MLVIRVPDSIIDTCFESDDPTLKYLIGVKYPSSEYEHSFNRDMLLDAERKFENRDVQLNQVKLNLKRHIEVLQIILSRDI